MTDHDAADWLAVVLVLAVLVGGMLGMWAAVLWGGA